MLLGKPRAVKPAAPSTGRAEDDTQHSDPEFPPGSVLEELPHIVKWRIVRSARTGGRTVAELYGDVPKPYVVSVLRHGPDPLAATLSQNITNKAVISALLLSFNYPALFSAADSVHDGGGPDSVDSLFRAYFFFQMVAVVCAFCVMLSAAIFVSHVLRCGKHVDSLINYLNRAIWIDNVFNEFTFIAQALFTVLSICLYVSINYPGALAWVLAGVSGLLVVVLLVLLLWSTGLFHAAAGAEWKELCDAEQEYRSMRQQQLKGGGGGGGGQSAAGLRHGAGIDDGGSSE